MNKQPNKSKTESTTRDRILMEAGPIFASKGYRVTTVREICDQAQVNVASINYYFGDKLKLYIETVILAREMRVKQVPYPIWDDSTKPEQKLRDFVELLLKRLVAMQSEPWQVRLLMREILQPTEACKHLVEEYFRPFFHVLCNVVDEIVGYKLPEFRRSQIGFSIIGQCLYYRFSADVTSMMLGEDQFSDWFDQASLAEHITEFSIGGIEHIKKRTSSKNAPPKSKTRKQVSG